MTGFGRADRTATELSVAVEVRSVNHRHLDLQLRIPDAWRGVEPAVRRLLSERVARGRVDLAIEVRDSRSGANRVRLDVDLARDLLAQAASFEPSGEARTLALHDVVALPGVVRFEPAARDSDATAEAFVLEVVGTAVAALEATRSAEGAALKRALLKALGRLGEVLAEVRARREPARRQLLERHRARVAELIGDVQIDASRLAQEAALLAERSDFEEELERLGAHLEQFRSALEAEGPIGKRLDFLAQEIHRELNTLGVKCRDGELTALVIDAKLECDRLREQLLNVE
jgi:uncharacterized protein (TIGR00255 family)